MHESADLKLAKDATAVAESPRDVGADVMLLALDQTLEVMATALLLFTDPELKVLQPCAA